MPYFNPDFNVKHFTDRLSSTVEWIGLLAVVLGIANHVMRQTITEVGVDFNYPDFLSRAAFSFVDMPRTIEMPAPFTNDVCLCVCSFIGHRERPHALGKRMKCQYSKFLPFRFIHSAHSAAMQRR